MLRKTTIFCLLFIQFGLTAQVIDFLPKLKVGDKKRVVITSNMDVSSKDTVLNEILESGMSMFKMNVEQSYTIKVLEKKGDRLKMSVGNFKYKLLDFNMDEIIKELEETAGQNLEEMDQFSKMMAFIVTYPQKLLETVNQLTFDDTEYILDRDQQTIKVANFELIYNKLFDQLPGVMHTMFTEIVHGLGIELPEDKKKESIEKSMQKLKETNKQELEESMVNEFNYLFQVYQFPYTKEKKEVRTRLKEVDVFANGNFKCNTTSTIQVIEDNSTSIKVRWEYDLSESCKEKLIKSMVDRGVTVVDEQNLKVLSYQEVIFDKQTGWIREMIDLNEMSDGDFALKLTEKYVYSNVK